MNGECIVPEEVEDALNNDCLSWSLLRMYPKRTT